MSRHLSRTVFLVLLALVFTVGLSFASVELPYLVDEAIQGVVSTPGFDSQIDEVNRLKTELFISHYHLRAVGYACFGAVLVLIIVGFATRRSGFAALGALAFMLPVFAQFAGVMFFLSGLGMLNVLWLPMLDLSFGLSGLGAVIRAPFDGLRWLFGLVGVNGYWPIVYFFIGSGLLIFFLGTLAWLSARARKEGVAVSWVYRISRHPQYLGWILWSYGIFLLLLQMRYPRRSWGISASLPWLISTLVIVGVAMLEELNMRRRHGEKYEAYRRTAPFLFPVPAFVERLFALPFRVLFKKDRPDRAREVGVVLVLYTALLIGASSLFYGGGWDRVWMGVQSQEVREARVADLVAQMREDPSARRSYFLSQDLGRMRDVAVDPLLDLLRDEDPEVRALAAGALREFPSQRAFSGLCAALRDPSEQVRQYAREALAALDSPESVEPLSVLLDDPAIHVRIGALKDLAELGAERVIPVAAELVQAPETWIRVGAVDALGALGSEDGLPVVRECLGDQEAWVRQTAVIALLRIGSPEAVSALEPLLADDDWQVRLYAAEALHRLGAEG